MAPDAMIGATVRPWLSFVWAELATGCDQRAGRTRPGQFLIRPAVGSTTQHAGSKISS